jgi:hypothetical protein
MASNSASYAAKYVCTYARMYACMYVRTYVHDIAPLPMQQIMYVCMYVVCVFQLYGLFVYAYACLLRKCTFLYILPEHSKNMSTLQTEIFAWASVTLCNLCMYVCFYVSATHHTCSDLPVHTPGSSHLPIPKQTPFGLLSPRHYTSSTYVYV